VSPDESQAQRERRKNHRSWVSKRSRRGLAVVAIDEPCHPSIARNEELAFRRLQSSPTESRKVANLEVPGLPMQQFEMIISAQNKFPAPLAIGFNLFRVNYLTANSGARVL